MQHNTTKHRAFDRVGISVSTSFAEGAHPRAMMERLGHSTINVTLGTYGHLFPNLEQRIDDALGDRYRSAESPASAEVRRLNTRNGV